MAAPKLLAHKDWMDRTDVKKWTGSLKKRSPELIAVDNMVDAYEKQPSPSNLEFLADALDKWVALKTKKNGEIVTCRDHDDAVTDLKAKVTAAMELTDPKAAKGYAGVFIGQDVYRGTAFVPDDFIGAVEEALTKIASKPNGKQMLKEIATACGSSKKIIIEYSGSSMAAPIENPTNAERKKVQKVSPGSPTLDVPALMSNAKLVATPTGKSSPDGKRKLFKNGAGVSAVVLWNHKDKGLDGRPAFIGLAHELIHAHHYVHGACYRAPTGKVQDDKDNGLMEEEMRTVGFGKYKGEIPSENAIRGEHGLAERDKYSATDSFDKVVATAING